MVVTRGGGGRGGKKEDKEDKGRPGEESSHVTLTRTAPEKEHSLFTQVFLIYRLMYLIVGARRGRAGRRDVVLCGAPQLREGKKGPTS